MLIKRSIVLLALTVLAMSALSGSPGDDLHRLALDRNWTELSKSAATLGDRLARSAHRDATQYGRIATYRALALHHLGQAREARWYWQVALNLASDVATNEIGKFPDAATVFAPIGVPNVQIKKDPSVRPARPTRTTGPSLLLAPDNRRPSSVFGVRLVVGADGIPHSPQVVGDFTDDADRVYSALEAFREWRFTPATENGVAVDFPMAISLDVGAAGKPPIRRARRF